MQPLADKEVFRNLFLNDFDRFYFSDSNNTFNLSVWTGQRAWVIVLTWTDTCVIRCVPGPVLLSRTATTTPGCRTLIWWDCADRLSPSPPHASKSFWSNRSRLGPRWQQSTKSFYVPTRALHRPHPPPRHPEPLAHPSFSDLLDKTFSREMDRERHEASGYPRTSKLPRLWRAFERRDWMEHGSSHSFKMEDTCVQVDKNIMDVNAFISVCCGQHAQGNRVYCSTPPLSL